MSFTVSSARNCWFGETPLESGAVRAVGRASPASRIRKAVWWRSRSKAAGPRTVANEMRRLDDLPPKFPTKMVLRKGIYPFDAVSGLRARGASTSLEVSSVHAVLEGRLNDPGNPLHGCSHPGCLDVLSRTLRSAHPISLRTGYGCRENRPYWVWPVKVKSRMRSAGTTVAESPWAGSAISRRSFEIAKILEKASRID